jgi:hypothetical protein
MVRASYENLHNALETSRGRVRAAESLIHLVS